MVAIWITTFSEQEHCFDYCFVAFTIGLHSVHLGRLSLNLFSVLQTAHLKVRV